VDPFISTKIIKPDDLAPSDDPVVSLVIFEWGDEELIGRPPSDRDDVCLWSALFSDGKLFASNVCVSGILVAYLRRQERRTSAVHQ
jgi:hypothetical protein